MTHYSLYIIMFQTQITKGKNAYKYTYLQVKFQKFFGALPPDPMLRRGYGTPPQTSPPSAFKCFAPMRLTRGFQLCP